MPPTLVSTGASAVAPTASAQSPLPAAIRSPSPACPISDPTPPSTAAPSATRIRARSGTAGSGAPGAELTATVAVVVVVGGAGGVIGGGAAGGGGVARGVCTAAGSITSATKSAATRARYAQSRP